MNLTRLALRGWLGGVVAGVLCLPAVTVAYSMARGNFFDSPSYIIRVATAMCKVGAVWAVAVAVVGWSIPWGQRVALGVLARRARHGLCMCCGHPLPPKGECAECGNRNTPGVTGTAFWWRGGARGLLAVLIINLATLAACELVVGTDELGAIRAARRAFATGRTTVFAWQRPFPCGAYTMLFSPDGTVGVWGE